MNNKHKFLDKFRNVEWPSSLKIEKIKVEKHMQCNKQTTSNIEYDSTHTFKQII